MAEVYDDERTETNQGQHDKVDLGAAEKAESDRIASSLGGGSSAGKSSATGNASSGANTQSAKEEDDFGYSGSGESQPKGLLGRIRGSKNKAKSYVKSKSNKVKAVIGGIVTVAIVVSILSFLSSLGLPNFTAHVIGWRLARITRETANTNSKNTQQKLVLDSASDSAYKTALDKWKEKVEKADKYRPKKIIQNMVSTGKMDLQYSEPKGPFQRQILEKMIIEGEVYDVRAAADINAIRSPIQYMKDKYQFKKDLKLAIHDSMRGRSFYMRWKSAKAARAMVKGKLYAWTKDDLKKYRNAATETADLENARESRRVATNDGESTRKAKAGSKSGDVNDAVEEATKNIDECVASDVCLKDTIGRARAGQTAVPNSVYTTLAAAFDSNVLAKILNVASPTYAVAVPLCLMYDGSIVNSQGVIDANSEQSQRLFYRVAAAGDQQKAGADNVNGEALGSLNRQLGQVSSSNIERMASGASVDTVANTTGAQASAGGTYTADIFNTFLPASVASVFSAIAGPTCAVMVSPWTNIGIILATLIPGVGEAMQAGGQITMRAIAGVIGKQLSQVARQFFTKKSAVQLGAIEGAALAGSLLGKTLVLQHLGTNTDGLQQDTDFTNVVDMGGDLVGQELDRTQNFGAPLTNAETNKLKPLDLAFMDDENKLQSPYKRYLAIDNPGSLTNEVAVKIYQKMNINGVKSILSSSANLLNPVKLMAMATQPFHKFATVKAQSASSVNNSNYNNVQIGWTTEEEKLFMEDPNYGYFPNQEALDASGKEDEITEKYGKCFDVNTTMGKLLAGGEGSSPSIFRHENGDIITNKGDCSPDNLGINNPTYGDLVFRWRVAHRMDTGLDNVIDAQILQAQ